MCLRGDRFFFFNFQLKFLQFSKNLPTLKRIWALLTLGQMCTESVLQPFTFDNFQSERPVAWHKLEFPYLHIVTYCDLRTQFESSEISVPISYATSIGAATRKVFSYPLG